MVDGLRSHGALIDRQGLGRTSLGRVETTERLSNKEVLDDLLRGQS
jgi:hypothetical protein